ncbi:MAG: 2,3-bisphosphoglycerate-independent phosphoglycerate mutase [Candidatus Puniceispirillaceae bacterium]
MSSSTHSSSQSAPVHGPVVLCIMDGGGLAPADDTNAVTSAHTPVFDKMMADYPNATLQASGPAVGLPEGQPGNSEVGHMNIGAGRCVLQDLPRIHQMIADHQLESLPQLRDFITNLQKTGGRVHLIGLFSDGGVHAHLDHSLALAKIFSSHNIEVLLHIITDGRDTLPKVAHAQWQAFAQAHSYVKVATLTGRYFAMDRDNRHERTACAFDAMATGKADFTAPDVTSAIDLAYDRGESDEFISATIIDGYTGFASGDGVMMTNFRVDRARQILSAFLSPDGINRPHSAMPDMISYLTMTPVFSQGPKLPFLIGPQDLSDGLGAVVAQAGLRQLRLAETEKYPHVTYFFNGGDEAPFSDEERKVIPSPKVATYDKAPQMSADGVLQTALASVSNKSHDLVIINFANPDMVGHTGDVAAARQAVEEVDRCVGALIDAVHQANGAMIVTADHGNCEVMWDFKAQSPHTAHTTNLVPAILVSQTSFGITDGCLADLAPSLLGLLGLSQPKAMTGKSLLTIS